MAISSFASGVCLVYFLVVHLLYHLVLHVTQLDTIVFAWADTWRTLMGRLFCLGIMGVGL